MRDVRSTDENGMTDEDYPGVFQRADGASVKAQKTRLRLERGRLGLLVAGSLFPVAYALVDESETYMLDGLVVLVLFLIVVLAPVGKWRRDDETWFDCRAIAESTKAATWRYMMRMSPYQGDGADSAFAANLKDMRQAGPSQALALAGELRREPSAITAFMRGTRSRPFEERKAFYMDARLRDQKDWYARRAKQNSDWNGYNFWAFMVLQVVAFGTAVAKMAFDWDVSVVPLFMTAAAALIAWGETRRYRELGKSYAMASQELEEQEAIAYGKGEEEGFLDFIDTVEAAISREHTMWCVKRDRT